MSLTPQQLEDKIKKVEEDLTKLRQTGGEEKKTIILRDYIDYLKDELKEARRRYVAK